MHVCIDSGTDPRWSPGADSRDVTLRGEHGRHLQCRHTDALWFVLGDSAHLRVGDTSPTHTYSTIHIQVSSRATLHTRPLLHMYIILYLK